MPGQQEQQRPSYLGSVSSFLLPQESGDSATPVPRPQSPDERSPPLISSFSTTPIISRSQSNEHLDRPLSNTTAHARLTRPNLLRAATTIAATRTSFSAKREPLRPRLNRALTSTAAIAGRYSDYLKHDSGPDTMEGGRASFLSRATQVISNKLELGEGSSYAHRIAPAAPSNWNDQAHRRYLVRIWDAVEEKAAASKYTVSTTARVVSTEKSMVHAFPELSEGEVKLTRDYIEYVLGVALRNPFCTAEKMGRWEILASSSGARGTWGPW